MESTGMMKMATGEGSPLRQGAGTGSRLVFGGYGGFWRRNSRSIVRSGSFRVRRYIWVQEVRRRSHVKRLMNGGAGAEEAGDGGARYGHGVHVNDPRPGVLAGLLIRLQRIYNF